MANTQYLGKITGCDVSRPRANLGGNATEGTVTGKLASSSGPDLESVPAIAFDEGGNRVWAADLGGAAGCR